MLKILKPSIYIFTSQAILEAQREKSAPSLCSFLPTTVLIYGCTGSTAREKGRERKGQKRSSWTGAGLSHPAWCSWNTANVVRSESFSSWGAVMGTATLQSLTRTRLLRPTALPQSLASFRGPLTSPGVFCGQLDPVQTSSSEHPLLYKKRTPRPGYTPGGRALPRAVLILSAPLPLPKTANRVQSPRPPKAREHR